MAIQTIEGYSVPEGCALGLRWADASGGSIHSWWYKSKQVTFPLDVGRWVESPPGWEQEDSEELHAFEWAQGNLSDATFQGVLKWIVLEYVVASAIRGKGVSKFPQARVVAVGDKAEILAWIKGHTPSEKKGLFLFEESKGESESVVVVGDGGTAIGGWGATAVAGDYGIAETGNRGVAVAGEHGTAKAGEYGRAEAGTLSPTSTYGKAFAGKFGVAVTGAQGRSEAGYGGRAEAGFRGIAIAGDFGTAIAGNYGNSTAGDGGKAESGIKGQSKVGNFGHAEAGEEGIARAGIGGTAAVGERGEAGAGIGGKAKAGMGGKIRLTWFNPQTKKGEVQEFYAGSFGLSLKPDTYYRIDDTGNPVKVSSSE